MKTETGNLAIHTIRLPADDSRILFMYHYRKTIPHSN